MKIGADYGVSMRYKKNKNDESYWNIPNVFIEPYGKILFFHAISYECAYKLHWKEYRYRENLRDND